MRFESCRGKGETKDPLSKVYVLMAFLVEPMRASTAVEHSRPAFLRILSWSRLACTELLGALLMRSTSVAVSLAAALAVWITAFSVPPAILSPLPVPTDACCAGRLRSPPPPLVDTVCPVPPRWHLGSC